MICLVPFKSILYWIIILSIIKSVIQINEIGHDSIFECFLFCFKSKLYNLALILMIMPNYIQYYMS